MLSELGCFCRETKASHPTEAEEIIASVCRIFLKIENRSWNVGLKSCTKTTIACFAILCSLWTRGAPCVLPIGIGLFATHIFWQTRRFADLGTQRSVLWHITIGNSVALVGLWLTGLMHIVVQVHTSTRTSTTTDTSTSPSTHRYHGQGNGYDHGIAMIMMCINQNMEIIQPKNIGKFPSYAPSKGSDLRFKRDPQNPGGDRPLRAAATKRRSFGTRVRTVKLNVTCQALYFFLSRE